MLARPLLVALIGPLLACMTPPSDPDHEVDTLWGQPPLEHAPGRLPALAREYFVAIADDDPMAIAEFLEKTYTPGALSQLGLAGWTESHLGTARRVGSLPRSLVVEVDQHHLEVLTLMENGDEELWLSWVFLGALDGSPRLRGIQASPAAPPEDWAPRLTATDAASLASDLKETLQRPAVALAVISADELDAAVVGVRRNDRPERARQSDALLLGPANKTVTALLVASLVDEGLLSWEDSLGSRLGDVFALHPAYETVTLAQVARHRAGVVGHSRNSAEAKALVVDSRSTPTEQRAAYLRVLLAAAPEEGWPETREVNAGHHVLAHVCEQVTGESYETLSARRVLEPLGIETASSGPGRISGHVLDEQGVLSRFVEGTGEEGSLAQAGDLALSLEDFARLMLQHAVGAGGGSAIVSAAQFEEMQATPWSHQALGLGRWARHGRISFGDEGAMRGCWVAFRAWPELGVATVAAVNGPVDEAGKRQVHAVFDALLRGVEGG
ncbi:MAG: serine hydrolase [Acidobacteriota bacterium]